MFIKLAWLTVVAFLLALIVSHLAAAELAAWPTTPRPFRMPAAAQAPASIDPAVIVHRNLFNSEPPPEPPDALAVGEHRGGVTREAVEPSVSGPADRAVHTMRFRIDREVFEAQSEGCGSRQAIVEPRWSGKVLVGMEVTRVVPTSLLARMGLAYGDIFWRIDGELITNPIHVLRAYEGLRLNGRSRWEVMRRGRSLALEYVVGR